MSDVPLNRRVDADLLVAMKARDAFRTGVLRMVKAALKNKEIEKQDTLTNSDSVSVLRTLLKQRREAMEQFQSAGRLDLAEKEALEADVVESYLPEPVSQAEIERVARAVSDEHNARGPQDMGVVMKETMSRLSETGKQVDGKLVSSFVREHLQSLGKRAEKA